MAAAMVGLGSSGIFVAVVAASLAASVFAAVHHADVVAHRVGEPYGTLVLALAVTLIEVALIVSLMIAGGDDATALARDTVFAAVMIILNGIIGLCLLVGGLKHREQTFSLDGVSAALVALGAIVVLTLVFPNYTVTTPGPYYSSSQLILIAVVSLVIYGAFVFAQSIGHRGMFVPDDPAEAQPHAPPAQQWRHSGECGLAAGLLDGSGPAREKTSAQSRGGRRARRRAQRAGGRDHCRHRAAAGGLGGHTGRARQSAADQSQSCARLSAGEHWLDHSDGRHSFALPADKIAAGYRQQINGAVDAVAIHHGHRTAHRQDHPHARYRAAGYFCRVSVHDRGSMMTAGLTPRPA
jgi:hypothetical protein